jgi:dihydrodipicolinate synthase/N-acetylneuraminate lyase
VPTIKRLAEFERIVGIKDSSGDLAFMMRMISAVRPLRPDFFFLTGWDAVLVPMLLIGVDGGTNALSGVVPELMRKLYDLTRAGQIDEAMRLQFRMLELFDAMLYSADFPEGFRAAVELRGFRVGPGRQPQTDRQRIDRIGLQKVLQCILADFGYFEGAPDCCPPRTGDINRDRVSHIAATVLEELHRRGAV